MAILSVDFGCVSLVNGNEHVYLFSHYQMLFPSDKVLFGKPLYGSLVAASSGNPSRKLGEETLLELKVKHQGAESSIVPDDQLIENALEWYPALLERSKHHFAKNCVAARWSDVACVVEPKAALQSLSRHKEIAQLADFISDEFGVETEDLGLTGSSLISGIPSPNDHDIVIYCDAEDSREILRTVRQHHKRGFAAAAFGINWPYRFRHAELGIICIFLAYRARSMCPIDLSPYEILAKNRAFSARITNCQYGGFAPSLYRRESQCGTWVIVLGTAARSMFDPGEELSGTADIVATCIEGQLVNCILIAFPFSQIDSFPRIGATSGTVR